MENNFLESIIKQFEYYKMLGDNSFSQLEEGQLFQKINEESNSIAIIINHLYGNMLSRWTDFLTADGEKDWRNRDAEFEDVEQDREDILKKWETGWNCLFTALKQLTENDLGKIIYIRNQGHTVMEAVHRQLAHYAYHVGQIVFIGKLIKGTLWNSLSIPKGNSQSYNSTKFEQPRHREHFSDEFRKPGKN